MELFTTLKKMLKDCHVFIEQGSRLRLRKYQESVAVSIIKSAIFNEGLNFVVIFPRQSGKNELQAQIECYLLTVMSGKNDEIVKVSPTFKPQTLNAMRRIQRVLEKNIIARELWSKESGFIYKVGKARMYFFEWKPECQRGGCNG